MAFEKGERCFLVVTDPPEIPEKERRYFEVIVEVIEVSKAGYRIAVETLWLGPDGSIFLQDGRIAKLQKG